MFDSLLIANRGEIACRIIHTARRMGITTIAVYSDADAGALHTRLADRSVRIGPAPVAESYVNAAAMLNAARMTKADAIHPGYGFLAESPDFATAVADAGLVFIGPSPQAIRAMGLKDAAKTLMAQVGVPVVPGWQGADQDPRALQREAARIRYPLLIKAVAGGGGKGMRLVETPSQFAPSLTSARAEAQTAFGNSAVLLERYIDRPRHIEVQVFGDGTKAVHLFERDCSLQRRHQKVIEEAPAPGMTAPMRAAICTAAVQAAEAIGYSGAGTVEFIVDASDGLHPDRFWFMEMNTRLQVEHPVTEAVTGIDLVEWQLKVAAGQPLPRSQDQITLTGHAIEARLYAEDVPAGFLPATGRLTHLAFPPGLRVECGVEAGDSISPWYDPMIAKLVAHGADRTGALAALQTGLARTELAGTVTNLGFLRRLLTAPGLVSGDVDTGLIARDLPHLAAPPDLDPPRLAQAALLAAGLFDAPDPWSGFALWDPLPQQIELIIRGEPVVAMLVPRGPGQFGISVPGAEVLARYGPGGWAFDGRPAVAMGLFDRTITVFDRAADIDVPDPLARGCAGEERDNGADAVQAPMPGLIQTVHSRPGDRVAFGDPLVVIEAMKMEHVLRAPRAGIVDGVLAQPGQQVDAGDRLVTLEPKE